MPVKLKEPLEKRIDRMMDEAIELADLGGQRIPAIQIAERIYDTEPELIEELNRPWITEKLAWLISRRRRAQWDAQYPGSQMVLNDPVFHDLPRTIFLRNGKRPNLDRCTLAETSDHLKLLRERFRNHPRVSQFERIVELHRKWAGITRNISWADAKTREAELRAK